MATKLKGHPHLGAQLFNMLRHAGFQGVKVRVVQPVFTRDMEGCNVTRMNLEDIRQRVVSFGMATNEEVDRLHKQLEELEQTEGAIISMPRIFQVTGHTGEPL